MRALQVALDLDDPDLIDIARDAWGDLTGEPFPDVPAQKPATTPRAEERTTERD